MQRERKMAVRPGRQQGSWVATVAGAETQEKVEGRLGFSFLEEKTRGSVGVEEGW